MAVVRGPAVMCALILVSILGAGCAADSTGVSAAGHPTVAPTQASATREPTATPLPAIREDAAVLGGAVYAFDKAFGNTCCYRNGWDHQGPYGPMWTGIWYMGYTYGAIDGQSKGRVTLIDNRPTQSDTPGLSPSWSMGQAEAMCDPYMPPDARYQATTAVYLGNLVAGSEKRYSSALLANTLPASEFKDVNGHAVAPGTFYVYFDTPDNGATVWNCALSTDEHDAQQL